MRFDINKTRGTFRTTQERLEFQKNSTNIVQPILPKELLIIPLSLIGIHAILSIVGILEEDYDSFMFSFVDLVITLVVSLVTDHKLKRAFELECVATVSGYLDVYVRTKFNTYELASTPVFEFQHDGRSFMVYEPRYKSDVAELPLIGSKIPISFDSHNPYNCTSEDSFKRSWLIQVVSAVILVILILPVALNGKTASSGNPFPFSLPFSNSASFNDDGKLEIDDKWILREAKMNNSKASFYVYEGTVRDIEGDVLYLDDLAGCFKYISVVNPNEFEEGDDIYIADFSSIYDVYVLNKDRYEYIGDNLYSESLKHDKDGKDILTDEYLDFVFQCSSWDIYEVEIESVNDDSVILSDPNNKKFILRTQDVFDIDLMHVKEEKKYYFITSSSYSTIISMDEACYGGDKYV